MTPAESFERLRPHLAAAGVTRVADITGLDRIGIPTFISVRPAARTLAVDSGKGTTADHARASAVYESIERHVGETAEIPHDRMTLAQLEEGDAHAVNLPRVAGSVLRRDALYPWAWARDVNAGGQPVAVPLAAVRLMAGNELPLGECVWASTSNGLSAATDYDRAVFQALCEVIERDACACHQWTMLALGETTRSWLAGLCFDPVKWTGGNLLSPIPGLLDKIHAAECEVRCFDFTMPDTGVPAVECFLFEPGAPEAGIYKGYGAHPDPEIAVRRAITEAAQGRCVIVAGARDDIDSATYERQRTSPQIAEFSRWLRDMVPTDRPCKMWLGFEWPDLAEKLREAGFPRVLVYDFGEHFGAHVVRVIVPGISGYFMPNAPVDERMAAFAESVKTTESTEDTEK